jgi:chromosome segregation ATPase
MLRELSVPIAEAGMSLSKRRLASAVDDEEEFVIPQFRVPTSDFKFDTAASFARPHTVKHQYIELPQRRNNTLNTYKARSELHRKVASKTQSQATAQLEEANRKQEQAAAQLERTANESVQQRSVLIEEAKARIHSLEEAARRQEQAAVQLERTANESVQQQSALLEEAKAKIHSLEEVAHRQEQLLSEREAIISQLSGRNARMQEELEGRQAKLTKFARVVADQDEVARTAFDHIAELEARIKVAEAQVKTSEAHIRAMEDRISTTEGQAQAMKDEADAARVMCEELWQRAHEQEIEFQTALEQERTRMEATREAELLAERLSTKRAMDVSQSLTTRTNVLLTALYRKFSDVGCIDLQLWLTQTTNSQKKSFTTMLTALPRQEIGSKHRGYCK